MSNRPSPSDHAKDFPNKIKEGNDKNKYISKKDKNGIYKWFKIVTKKSSEEYYQQFPDYTKSIFDTKIFTKNINSLSKELKKFGIIFSFIKWGTYSPEFEYEYFLEDNKINNLILYSENKLYLDARNNDGIMYLMHKIEKDKWDIVNDIFIKYFPNRTIGISTQDDALKIFFNEQKKLQKDKEKIRVTVDIILEDKTIYIESLHYLNKINKIIGKKIGYLDEYDKIINHGKVNADFNINFDKIDEFKKIIKNLLNNKYDLPKIKKIKYNIV